MRYFFSKFCRYALIPLTLSFVALIGCGGSAMVDVKGKVFYGDQPLKSTGLDQAIVQFHKQGEKADSGMYQGTFDEEGNYSLKAPAGKYKVMVIATKMPKAKEGQGGINYGIPETVIPKVYSTLSSTDKFVEVSADAKPEDYDIKLSKSK